MRLACTLQSALQSGVVADVLANEAGISQKMQELIGCISHCGIGGAGDRLGRVMAGREAGGLDDLRLSIDDCRLGTPCDFGFCTLG